MKVLLVKTSSLGDVIHTFPAVTDALAAVEGLALDWCVEQGFADIVRLHPGVGAVHEVAARRWREAPFSRATVGEIAGLRSVLRDAAYDLVIDAQGLFKSAAIARLAGAPVHGFDRSSAREGLASAAYAKRHAVSRGLHAIERTRRLMGEALGYRSDLSRIDYGLVAPSPPAMATGRDDFVLLLHGTTWTSKRWPLASWIGLAQALVFRGLTPVVTFASDQEKATAEAIAVAVPRTLVVAKSPLGEIAGLIGASRLVIGVDTGLMHLAAALGRPTLALFASTSPELTGPVGEQVRVLEATTDCAPCRKRVCPLVPLGADPPCHDTIGLDRVLPWIDQAARDA